MKNLLYIPTFLIFILVFSCGQNSSEKKLNGKWYGIENNGYTIMEFFPDSLIFIEFDMDASKWKANKSKIEFYLPTLISDSSGRHYIKDKITVKYKLSKGKDTLFGIFENRFGKTKINLLRAKDYIEFLNKRYEIDFSLPEDNSIKHIEIDDKFGLKVFIGYSNEKVVGRTELSADLNHLASDFVRFKDSIKPNGRPEVDGFPDYRFHLRIFADKNISDSTITKYLPSSFNSKISQINEHLPEGYRNTAPDTIPIRIYRIYETEEDERMKGKKIKTIANTVYNLLLVLAYLRKSSRIFYSVYIC